MRSGRDTLANWHRIGTPWPGEEPTPEPQLHSGSIAAQCGCRPHLPVPLSSKFIVLGSCRRTGVTAPTLEDTLSNQQRPGPGGADARLPLADVPLEAPLCGFSVPGCVRSAHPAVHRPAAPTCIFTFPFPHSFNHPIHSPSSPFHRRHLSSTPHPSSWFNFSGRS